MRRPEWILSFQKSSVFSTDIQIILWVLAACSLSILWFAIRNERRMLQEQRRIHDQLAQQGLALTRMQQSFENAAEAFSIADTAGRSLYHNHAHRALFGYSVEELNAEQRSHLLFTDVGVAAEIQESVQAERTWTGETEVRTKSGRTFPASVRVSPIRDDHQSIVGVFSVFTDISERVRTGQLLVEQRYRLEITLQSISDAVLTLDRSGRILLMNPAAEQLLGITRASAVNQPLSDKVHLLDEHTHEDKVPPVLALLNDSSSSPRSAHVYRLKSVNSSGERIIAENAALIRNAEGAIAGAVLALRDITRERQLADESARASKLESLGLLAGGIAHDFGNLLATMLAHLSLAQLEPGLPPGVREHFTQLERIIWRARDITQQLLTFARGEAPKKRPVSLPLLLREAVQFAAAGHQIETDFLLTSDLPSVEADEGQLLQVINNLAVNAVQAMPNGGKLTVKAGNYQPDLSTPVARVLNARRMVEIIVSDTGGGIPPENLSKIFDPFFTTKKTGNGLGLATSYTIVKQHGGKMRVESTVGRGTTFQLLLPASNEPVPDASTETKGSPASLPPRLGRVMVVDDERALRESLVLMLTMLNYDAIEARSGEEALTLYSQAQGTSRPIDVVLLDLNLAEKQRGESVLKKLLATDPRVKSIAMSGSLDDPVLVDFATHGFCARVQKPVAMSDLKTLLHQSIPR